MFRHPGRPEYVEGAEADTEIFSQELRRYTVQEDWVIDGIRNNASLRRDVRDSADQTICLELPLATRELHVLRRRLRRRKPITVGFVRGRVKKARKYPTLKKRLETDLKHHAAKTVTLRSHREIDRYLAQLRTSARGTS